MIRQMNFRACSGWILGVRQKVTSAATLRYIGPSIVSLLLIAIEARTGCSSVTLIDD